MFRKLALIITIILLTTFNANAGSDGELILEKNQPTEIKDCFDEYIFTDSDYSILINKELMDYRRDIDLVSSLFSKKEFYRSFEETKSKINRRSIFSIKKISKGEKLTANNISTFRPEIGLPADKFKNILGKRLRKSLVAFSPIFKKDLFN